MNVKGYKNTENSKKQTHILFTEICEYGLENGQRHMPLWFILILVEILHTTN